MDISKVKEDTSSTINKDIVKYYASGTKYFVGQCIFKDQLLDYPVLFSGLENILHYLSEDFIPRHDDVWLLTYPKSGTHWLREIIAMLQNGNFDTPKHSEMLEMYTEGSEIEEFTSPRILKMHIPVDILPSRLFETTKTIYLVRNPKATAVSFYEMHHNLEILNYTGNFSEYLELYNSPNGQYSLNGTWYDHILSHWNSLQSKSNVLFVFYEQLARNPAVVIEKIADFLKLDRNKEFCQAVAKLTTFDVMFKAEEEENDTVNWKGVWKNGKKRLLRKGTIDDWKNYFTVSQSEEFDRDFEEKLKDYPELRAKISFE